MEEIGTCVNESILGHRHAFEDRRLHLAKPERPTNHPAFRISRDPSDPKSRWVNGTPEYSFGIGGLRRLFPAARFIHLVRDCDPVVDSMLNFERVAGTRLVETEEEGYHRWLAYVRACVRAEAAYGPAIVCRVFHEELVREPENSIHRILDFAGEPFDPACLEPLTKKINTSKVEPGTVRREPPADPALISEARELWNSLRENPSPATPLPSAASLIDEQFESLVDYAYDLDTEYLRAQLAHKKLQGEFEERTEWALRLDEEVGKTNRQIRQLQAELSERTRWAQDSKEEIARRDAFILQLQKEFAERTVWALDLQAECTRKDSLISELQARLDGATTKPDDALALRNPSDSAASAELDSNSIEESP